MTPALEVVVLWKAEAQTCMTGLTKLDPPAVRVTGLVSVKPWFEEVVVEPVEKDVLPVFVVPELDDVFVVPGRVR